MGYHFLSTINPGSFFLLNGTPATLEIERCSRHMEALEIERPEGEVTQRRSPLGVTGAKIWSPDVAKLAYTL